MPAPNILAFAGSVRKESFNRKLLSIAVKGVESFGANVTHIELRDYELPLFDQDLEKEKGLPQNAKKIKELMIKADGFLIASPEYNSSITPLLKNTLDWASRSETKEETPLVAYKGKVAGLISASPGNLGGLRSLVTVRSLLGNIGAIVIPTQFALVKASEAFTDDGLLKDPKNQKSLDNVLKELIEVTGKLKK